MRAGALHFHDDRAVARRAPLFGLRLRSITVRRPDRLSAPFRDRFDCQGDGRADRDRHRTWVCRGAAQARVIRSIARSDNRDALVDAARPRPGVERPHRELLQRAGFVEVTETDCSAEFVAVAQAWIDQWDLHRAEMEPSGARPILRTGSGADAATSGWSRREIMRRSLFTARPHHQVREPSRNQASNRAGYAPGPS